MKKCLYVLFVLVLVLSACAAPGSPAAATASESSAAQPTSAPAQGPADSSYSVSGDTVTVSASGKTIASVKIVTKVDNMPTEWLKGREGVVYLYQSGIGNQVELIVTLYENGAFAIDGDWMKIGNTDLGKVNDSADFRAFADNPGEYHFTASSFGLAVGVYRDANDKAGFVLADRRNADNDNRPEYWLPSDGGQPQEVGK